MSANVYLAVHRRSNGDTCHSDARPGDDQTPRPGQPPTDELDEKSFADPGERSVSRRRESDLHLPSTSVVNCKVSSFKQMVSTLDLGHPRSARSLYPGQSG